MTEKVYVPEVDAGPQFPRFDRRARNLELVVRSARIDKVEQPIARRGRNEMVIGHAVGGHGFARAALIASAVIRFAVSKSTR
jgi:hypothetical protein